MKTRAKELTASEFKARCLKILDELEPQGVVTTKRGRPVAKVIPLRSAQNADVIGCMKGKVKIKGNIFSTGIRWNAHSGRC
jgi:prevent-host-death family protein